MHERRTPLPRGERVPRPEERQALDVLVRGLRRDPGPILRELAQRLDPREVEDLAALLPRYLRPGSFG